MKKLMLLLSVIIVTLFTTSCSDDDTAIVPVAEAASSVNFKINGIQKTYTNVSVSESLYTFEDLSIPSYSVLATPEDQNGDFIAFQIRRDYTGLEGIYEFIYQDANGIYNAGDDFALHIITNNENSFNGIFSGSLQITGGDGGVLISDGSFDINF